MSPRRSPRLGASLVLQGVLGAHENLRLSGDYFAEPGNIEAAARTGLPAAERVDAPIRAVTRAEAFPGVLPALITPFTEHGSASDSGARAAIVDRLVGAGVSGLVPRPEHRRVHHADQRRAPPAHGGHRRGGAGRVPVVAGTGALSTRFTTTVVRA